MAGPWVQIPPAPPSIVFGVPRAIVSVCWSTGVLGGEQTWPSIGRHSQWCSSVGRTDRRRSALAGNGQDARHRVAGSSPATIARQACLGTGPPAFGAVPMGIKPQLVPIPP